MVCFRATPDGVVIAVRLTPRAARDAIDGIDRLSDGAEVVKARVRAVPSEGAANEALRAVLAEALKVPKRAVNIVSGASGRLKQVHISGDAPSLSGIIEKWPRRA